MYYLEKEVNDEVHFWHANKHRSLLQADTIHLGMCNQVCPTYPKQEVFLSLQYRQKSKGMKLILCLEIIMKVFFKLIVSLQVCITRHAQGTQNNKFAISLQYLNENVNDEVDFLPADNCQRFLQIDTIILGLWPGMLKLPKIMQISMQKIHLLIYRFYLALNFKISTKNYKNFKISVYFSVIHTKRVKIVIQPESTDIHNLSPGLLKDCGNIKIIVS